MIKMDNVKQFSSTATDLMTAFETYAECEMGKRTFSETSKSEMEEAINKEFMSEVESRCGVQRDAYMSDRKWANNTQVVEMADAIRTYMIDMILPQTLLDSALSTFVDFRFSDLGDSLSFDLENNALYNVTKAGYRKRSTNLQKLWGTTVTLVPENRMLTVGTDLFEIMSGRVFIAREVMKAVRSIMTAVYFDCYDSFKETMDSYAPSPLTITNPTETDIITACEKVGGYNGGRKPIILGTPVALKKILPDNNNYRFTLEDEYVKVGFISTYNTYDVVAMEQVANPYDTTADYSLKLADDRIYIVSPQADKIVKCGFGGETMSHTDDVFDNANLLQLTTIAKAWDTQVITNSVASVLKFS